MQITINVPDSEIAQALESAISGISYWGYFKRTGQFHGLVTETYPDPKAPGFHCFDINPEKVAIALGVMAEKFPDSFQQLLRKRADMVVGDLLVQLVCFGEEKYA